MHTYKHQSFSIYFGDASKSFSTIEELRILQKQEDKKPLQEAIKLNLARSDLPSALFLHQVHGVDGTTVTPETASTFASFQDKGDLLLTATPEVPLGVLTADCLPIVFFDPQHQALAVAHAGWKGSLLGIVGTVVEKMQKTYATDPATLEVFLGPCAQQCCYEVSLDFGTTAHKPDFLEQSIIKRDEKIFFDNIWYTTLALCSLGVQQKNINNKYSECTMCNERYCSYRRKKDASALQPTIAMLHPACL